MEDVPKILVVDDDENHLSLIRRSYELFGENVELKFCSSFSEAVSLLNEKTIFQLAIIDLVLNDGYGLELAKMIKMEQPGFPVIIFTGRGSEDVAIECMKNGATDYLIKRPEVFMRLPHLAKDVIGKWGELQRKLREENEMRENEKKLRLVLNNLSDIVWVVDSSFSRYTYVCPSIEKFIGYSPNEMLHLPLNHVLEYDSSKKVEKFAEVLKKKVQSGFLKEEERSLEVDLVFEHKEGGLRWGHIKFVLLYENEQFVGVAGVTRDITDRKIAEERQKENIILRHRINVTERVARIKEQFLANMSHEIRTPMTGIMGMADLLAKTPLNDTQKSFLNVIRSSSTSLLKVVDQIIDLVRIKEGKAKLNSIIFNPEEHGQQILGLFSALIEQKKLSSSFEYDARVPKLIKADEIKLGQILSNILGNAVKFTHKGYVRMVYSLQEDLQDDVLIRIDIYDSGIGISAENQEKLFDVFTQVDESDTRTYEGAGLGLSLSQKYARMMGGNIHLESKPGKGSHFWFEFLAEKVAAEEIEEKLKPAEGVSSRLECQGKVLLVEDKKTNQMVVSLMLREAGCEVEVANHGQEALEKFDPGKYNLILMDIQMPVMDGLTAARELHRRYSKMQVPPIVGLSAKAMEGDAEYYISKGFDDYITKPVNSTELQNKVLYWINKEEKGQV